MIKNLCKSALLTASFLFGSQSMAATYVYESSNYNAFGSNWSGNDFSANPKVTGFFELDEELASSLTSISVFASSKNFNFSTGTFLFTKDNSTGRINIGTDSSGAINFWDIALNGSELRGDTRYFFSLTSRSTNPLDRGGTSYLVNGASRFSNARIEGVAGNWTFSAPAPAVPEPGAWAMMILGFGFVGGAMRTAKRRQAITVSYA